MRGLILAAWAIAFLGDDEIICDLRLLLAYWYFLFWTFFILILFVIGILIILVHKWEVCFSSLWLDINVEVLRYVFNIIVLYWLPVIMNLYIWMVVIVIVFDVVSNVWVLIEWEELLLLLEVALWSVEMRITEMHFLGYHCSAFSMSILLFLKGLFIFNWVFARRYLRNIFVFKLH